MIPTLDNLMKRGLTIANRCYLCKTGPESCNHLLLWCSTSYKLWAMVLGLLGISWVMADSITSELLAWEGLSSRNKLFKLIPLTIFWVIWKERNKRAFEGKELDFNTIKNNWFHYFGSIVLGHNLDCSKDFAFIVNILIGM